MGMRVLLARPHPDRRDPPILGQASAGSPELLRQHGALVDVELGAPAAGRARRGPQALRRVRALVDTGASVSVLDEPEALAAGLMPTGFVYVAGVGGGVARRTVYAAAAFLPKFGVRFDPVQLAAIPLTAAGAKMLIGRDMLQRLRFDYQGRRGVFVVE